MEVQNHTPFVCEPLLHARRGQSLFLTLIVKATYEILPDRRVQVAAEQRPVAASPTYGTTEDQDPLLELEADRVPFKPRTDIAVVGSVYAPDGEPVNALYAMLRVGSLRKTMAVYGDRRWQIHSERISITHPSPFTTLPLTYERAFGGVDLETGKRYDANPAGRGFVLDKAQLQGQLLPNFEQVDHPIRSWTDRPAPVGFGFLDGAWQPRRGYAGKLDVFEEWEGTVLMPPDFDENFYNAAHPDLQVEGYLRGDEVVEMQHLSPEGFLHFELPGVRPIITVERHAGDSGPDDGDAGRDRETQFMPAPLDTVVFFPDQGIFYQVWRGQCPVRSLQLDEIESISVRVEEVDIKHGIT